MLPPSGMLRRLNGYSALKTLIRAKLPITAPRTPPLAPDNKQILFANLTEASIWDASAGKKLYRFPRDPEKDFSFVYAVAFASNGRQILTGMSDGTIDLWDIASGKKLRAFNGHTSTVNTLRLSRDGKQMLSSSWDQTVVVWNFATGKESKHLSEICSSFAVCPS